MTVWLLFVIEVRRVEVGMTSVGARFVSDSLAGMAFEAGRAPEDVFAADITLVEDIVVVGTLVSM